ncbi:MAG: TonB-dependent receptor, partial [Rikenellaceae bacterium]
SNLNQTGTTDNSHLKRNSISFSGTAKMNKYLDSWVTANYVNTKAKGRQEVGYGDKNPSKTMFQWVHTELDYDQLRAYKNPNGTQRTWNRTSWNNATPAFADNPYWTLNENYENDNRDRFYGNAGININVIDGLKITGRIGVDAWMYKIEERMAEGSALLSSYNLVNRTSVETNMDLFATYNKRFANDKFGLSAMLGATSNDRKYAYSGGETVGGLSVPGIYNLTNSMNKATSYDKKTWQRINAIYANLTLDYNQLIYLDLTARNDWSSTLPTANRSYFYPSVNLSLMLNQIGGLKDLKWLDFAKIRGGYAQVGNDTNPYYLQDYYTIESPFGSNPMYSISSTLNNPDLRSEKTKSWEIGLEAQFLNRRLGFDIAYYQKKTIDQIIPASVSSVTGYSSRYINAGELQNSGVELTINATPIASKSGFRWDMQLNIATLKNEVKSIAPGIEYLQLGSNGFSVYSGAVVGESYPVIYGKNYLYGENGEKLVGTNGRYLKTKSNEAIGKVTPDFTAGFSNTFTWKGFDVNILFDMQMGGHMYYLSNKYGMYSGIMAETAMRTNVPNKTGDIREDGYIIEDAVYGKNVYDPKLNKYVPTYVDKDGKV